MKGLFPILATPFDEEDRIDEEDLRREVDFVIENGAHGVGIAFASEVVKLSEAERDVATRTVVEQARGRVPVVVNTGGPSTAVTVQYSRRAEELGADASMVTPPVGVSAEVVKEYYHRVSDATTIPIFIQGRAHCRGVTRAGGGDGARDRGRSVHQGGESADTGEHRGVRGGGRATR